MVTNSACHMGLDFLARQADDLLKVGIAAYRRTRVSIGCRQGKGIRRLTSKNALGSVSFLLVGLSSESSSRRLSAPSFQCP
jgi:hypothetical protein